MSVKKEDFTEVDIIELARKTALKSLKVSPFRELITTDLGDDCFGFKQPEPLTTVVTTDVLIEGVHFALNWISPRELALRSINVNFSDLASQGAQPVFVFLNLGIKKGMEFSFFREFFAGILKGCRSQGAVLAGGDTSLASALKIGVTAIGFAEVEMKRSAARPGDLLAVTGRLGRAAAGYLALKKGLKIKTLNSAVKDFLVCKHRVAEGLKLVRAGVKCCEDISDGLVRDVSNIATASNVGFEIFLEKVPVAKELFFLKEYYADLNPYEMALTFGDDYELVFTASEEVLERVRKLGVKFAVIGRITADKRGRFIDANGKEVETGPGYLHLF